MLEQIYPQWLCVQHRTVMTSMETTLQARCNGRKINYIHREDLDNLVHYCDRVAVCHTPIYGKDRNINKGRVNSCSLRVG